MVGELLSGSRSVQAVITARTPEGSLNGGIAMFDCPDGRQESAAVCSLVQLLVDPMARTIWGFEVLLEKEWAQMGYMFGTAFAHTSDNWFLHEGSSALFLLWLDAVHQLIKAQPTHFEFDDRLLLEVGRHAFSCRFGNFLVSSDYESNRLMIHKHTISLWAFVNLHRGRFLNPDFVPTDTPLYEAETLASPTSKDSFSTDVIETIDYWRAFHHSINGVDQVASMHKEIKKGLFSSCRSN